jgi:hypothetical protein
MYLIGIAVAAVCVCWPRISIARSRAYPDVDPDAIHQFLQQHTGGSAYTNAKLKAGARRFNLDGTTVAK